MRALNLIGQGFGRLTVVAIHPSQAGMTYWQCLCACGKTALVSSKLLRNGDTKSCGCLHTEHAMVNVRNNEKEIGYKRVHKQSGRVEIRTESGFIYEHVYVLECKIGRKLYPHEVSHHKDENKSNNSPDNLELMERGAHTALHNRLRYNRRNKNGIT